MGTWVDFKKLREQLDFVEVLRHYDVELRRKGTQVVAICPLPSHQGEKKSRSFSANVEKKVWRCFGCHAQGNILDFIACMEGLDPRKPDQFRKAAVIAQERFGTQAASAKGNSPPESREAPKPVGSAKTSDENLPILVNPPLDFTLKNLDPKPDYLIKRGFTAETIAHFGLGYCSKGLFAGRIAIPLHDSAGQLIGYAGRIIFDDAVDKDNPKYLLPGRRKRNGVIHEFAKSLVLYNGHRINAPVDDLIVVEGFPSVWWLWQHGYENVVAIMGSACSADQAKFIVGLVRTSGRVWLFPDNDRAGWHLAETALLLLGADRFVRWVKSEPNQPTDCSPELLGQLLPIDDRGQR